MIKDALVALVLAFGCAGHRPPEAAKPSFAATLRPVLARACAPCHEPGGKMYARMPFDQPETVTAHREGILRRLKGADRDALVAWLATQPPPAPR